MKSQDSQPEAQELISKEIIITTEFRDTDRGLSAMLVPNTLIT
jgi:hypothetical protein